MPPNPQKKASGYDLTIIECAGFRYYKGTEATEDFGVVRRGQDRRETGRF
jgi:hypothetical protein